jgi:hypothetical protein
MSTTGRFYAITADVDMRADTAVKYGPYESVADAMIVALRYSKDTKRPFSVYQLSATNPGEMRRIDELEHCENCGALDDGTNDRCETCGEPLVDEAR